MCELACFRQGPALHRSGDEDDCEIFLSDGIIPVECAWPSEGRFAMLHQASVPSPRPAARPPPRELAASRAVRHVATRCTVIPGARDPLRRSGAPDADTSPSIRDDSMSRPRRGGSAFTAARLQLRVYSHPRAPRHVGDDGGGTVGAPCTDGVAAVAAVAAAGKVV